MTKTNKVKKLRLCKGWKQADLVRATGLSQYTISEIENHKHNISNEELELISKALNVKKCKIFKEE